MPYITACAVTELDELEKDVAEFRGVDVDIAKPDTVARLRLRPMTLTWTNLVWAAGGPRSAGRLMLANQIIWTALRMATSMRVLAALRDYRGRVPLDALIARLEFDVEMLEHD